MHFFDSSTSKSAPNVTCFNFFTCKCASRHSGVQLFISHLARWLRTRRFSEPTFDPPEPQIIGKTQCFATFLPFRTPGSSFFWLLLFADLLSSSLLFSSLTLPTSAFHLSILSEVWLLNFLRLYECIYDKTALCARRQEMKIQQYGGSGCAPFCNGHTWAKVQITDLLTRTCWLGWSPRHVKCRSACKLDSPNYHINDVSSFIRLRACISIVHFYHIEYSKLSTKHQILTDRILSYLHKTDRIFHGPGKTTSRTYVKCFKKVGIDSHK